MKRAALLAVAVMCVVGTAQAASIGVNFVNFRVNSQQNQAGYVLLPTESAGVEAQQNWNNYSMSNDTTGRIEWDPDAGDSGEWVRDIIDPTYIDSAGNDTGLDISWDIGGGWDAWGSVYSADGSSDGDRKLMSGNAMAVNDISLSNVPYTTYDLIVYVAGQGGQAADQSVTVSGDDFTDITKYVTKASGSTTIHTESDSTDSSAYEVGTYVRFNGLSGDSTINIGGNLSDISTGFQIVPEPAMMALLAFGGLGVLLRRRRSRS
ncbi:MAG: PEP-CTERM sorting domain-containing protein [Planctomycetes bacterium]|nr:PEP-CTERM sorting domain-containing protein [Planctomycetota bacterium]